LNVNFNTQIILKILLALIFNNKSWHYKLVVYCFTPEFFMEHDGLDFEAMDAQPSDSPDYEIIFKTKPKTVNLCPYARAVVAGIVTVPFVYLWRKYPHKPKPKRTHAQIMKNMERRSLIIRALAGGVNISLGLKNIIFDGGYMGLVTGIIQISIGLVLMTAQMWAPQLLRWIIKHWPKVKWNREKKIPQKKEPKKPSNITKKICETHDIICPPIWFVDMGNSENLK